MHLIYIFEYIKVITNSWGGGSGDPWYNEAMRAWIVAGQIPVFALGNSGPSCRSANSPGTNSLHKYNLSTNIR